jgi:hypothetical protein
MWKSVLVIAIMGAMVPASTSWADDPRAADIATTQAREPSTSIQSLYEQCTAADLSKHFLCVGYVSGIVDTMTVVGANDSSPSVARVFGMCPKASGTYGAAVQVFTNWAQQHPEAWGQTRYLGVAWALKQTWPCA